MVRCNWMWKYLSGVTMAVVFAVIIRLDKIKHVTFLNKVDVVGTV